MTVNILPKPSEGKQAFERPYINQILPLLSRLVPLFDADINNKTSWVFLGAFPIFFPLLFSVYLPYIFQP